MSLRHYSFLFTYAIIIFRIGWTVIVYFVFLYSLIRILYHIYMTIYKSLSSSLYTSHFQYTSTIEPER